ncbi:MAG TPA: TIGR02281 family clan AA aspartic protease [Rhizomicrobium sp.]
MWIALMLAVALGLFELARLFPGAITKEDQPYLVYMAGWLALLSAGFVFARRVRFGEAARNIAIWIAVAAVLVLGYSYRDVLSSAGTRMRSEFMPGDPVSVAPYTMVLTQDENGDFYVFGNANGARVRFLLDTGASDIVLAPADARRLGIDVATLNYVPGYETANGIGAGARVTLNTLSVGRFTLWNVPVDVNRTDMHASLLGMAFLKRMKSFEFRGRELILRW